MTRFSKGTTDHDGDGRMGGSRKESDMAKPAKKTTTKKPAEKVEPAVSPRAARKAALETEHERAAKAKPAMDVQTGMEPGGDIRAREEEIARQFKAADAEGRTKAEQAAIDDATLSRQIRGY